MRGLGYLTDKADPRDVLFSSAHQELLAASSLPEQDDHLIEHVTSVLDQGSMQACVGYAIARAATTMLSAEGLPPVEVSPGFIWSNSRRTHGDEQHNVGTYLREAIKTLSKLGLCADKHFPADELSYRFAERPPTLAYRAAYDARFGVSYYRIEGMGDELIKQVKYAISTGPFVFGVSVTDRFLDLETHAAEGPPKGDDNIVGGHAMCGVAYDDRGIIGPNSWGSGWGNEGWFHLSWSYVTSVYFRDAWAFRFVPALGGGS